MEEVAISLSGGGFRAAMFHLGTLSYLNHLKLSNDHSFLNIVNTILTISGGSITGLWYMMNICKGIDSETSFRELYRLLTTVDFPKDVWKSLMSKGNDNSSLIKEAVKFYDEKFFHGQTFGIIMEEADKGHIHHFSANGTDFNNGLAFRFQASKAIINTLQQFRYGFIGNKRFNIDREDAAKVKLSEILAVSSCFPGGFEPILFPNDFSFFQRDGSCLQKYKNVCIPLMDGGIVDNQGIEPILLASTQMTYDNPNAKNGDTKYPSHDLIIVSDVSSVKSKTIGNAKWKFSKRISDLNYKKVNNGLIVFTIIFILLLVVGIVKHIPFISGFASALLLIALFCLVLSKSIKSRISKVLLHTGLHCDWNLLKYLELGKINDLITSRISSLLHLASFVFMKPIRQMRYKQLYDNSQWKNRLVSNIITELSSDGSWRRKLETKKIPKYLSPSKAIIDNTDKANNMETTLWFTDSDIKDGMPQTLLAWGQYTICWNLLEYIEKLKTNMDNTTPTHRLIMQCEVQLRQDWEYFKSNPFFLSYQQ